MESEQNNLTQRKFRPEIEGLRAVAALLVAIYHIWVGQVSGGVDVFFVVSGFLITTSLFNRLEKNGSIDFFSFILRLMKRLFPMAFLVLLVTSLASILWLPQVRWSQTIQEVFASAFYYQNWQLAINSVDYLAQNNEASPFQHFWAMSIQGQFYLLWPLVLFIAYLAAKYIFKVSTRVTLTGVLTGLFAVSFSYSIYRTAVDQPWAYFDTLARVWEFSLGGLLAIMISKIILNKLLSAFLGWAGLLAIVVTGAALEVSTEFPGYAALWPVVGGILIIAAGNQGGALGVHRLLSWGPLTKFGSISYAFYLWHWPLLIFYYILTDTRQVSFFDGLLLMIGAALISYVSTVLIEKPIRTMKLPAKHWFSWATVVICMLPTLIVASWWAYDVNQSNEQLANAVEDENYPGALALAPENENMEYNQDLEVLPNPVQAREDLPKVYDDDCHQSQQNAEVIQCDYGQTGDSEYTVALVGGSHSAHWLPALEQVAENESIKIESYTKSSCRFNADGGEYDSCETWNQDLVEELVEEKPDVVFTTANTSDIEQSNDIPKGFVAQWERLEEAEVEVLALRDNPWFSKDIPSCVEENKNNLDECGGTKEELLGETVPWDDREKEMPENVTFTDFNDYICDDGQCDPVEGNVLIYRDAHHLTATYSRTLGPFVREKLMPILES